MPGSRLHYILTAPAPALLLRLSAPTVVLVLAQTGAVVADAWFVGHIGTAALASLAVVYPVQALMQMMSAGAMGGGISSAVARALGGGHPDRAAALVVHALVIALAMAALYTVLAGLMAPQLFSALGARGEVLDGAVRYAHVAFGGCIAVWLANTLASVLRGTGNMLLPGVVLVLAHALQVALCGGLTLGWGPLPALGVAGPAVALVASFSLAAAVLAAQVLSGLLSGRTGLALGERRPGLHRALFHDILGVGGVACLNALLTVSTVFIVTRLVAAQGTAALAGYGLGSRLELLVVPLTFGVGAALTASVGVNFGARQYARARRLAMTGGALVFLVTGSVGVVAALRPELWLGLFSADAAVHAVGHMYLRIVGPLYGFFGLGMALYFASQGTGKMLWPLTAGGLRLVVAAGGGAVVVTIPGLGAGAVFACVAAGLGVFGVTVALSLRARVWNPDRTPASPET